MYKIKDFSNRIGLSITTLRYYDEIDLFKPSYTDIYSGYRYYEDNQISLILKIENLKKVGLSLDEIKKDYESVNIYIPIEMVDLINYIKENYEFESQIKSQGDFQYDNIKFNLVKY